jgi:hypothetical protein
MPRITDDPTKAIRPDFEAPEWNLVRQSLINAHQDQPPLTAEDASQQLKDTWARGNEEKIVAWNAQLELDQAELAQQELQVQEAAEAERAQLEREAEQQRKEADKKKPKLTPFDPDCAMPSWVEARPAQYAIDKIRLLQYVELDYFTIRGCAEAAGDSSRSISHDTLTLSQFEGAISLRPLAAHKASRNIRNDRDLSWEEVFDAKNTMLHYMDLSEAWPVAHADSLAAFYFELEVHPRRHMPNGKKTLLLYQCEARREWFRALERGRGFNTKLIQEEFLRTCADKVNAQANKEEMEQVRTMFPQIRTQLIFPPPFFSFFRPSTAAASLSPHLGCPTPRPCHPPLPLLGC